MQGTENKPRCEFDPAWGSLAEKIAASAGLARSPRLRKLFLYLCDRTRAGASDELREHTIGEAVFGRPPGYDTASENIVRVSVSQLRKRLERYFAGEGAAEPIVITIPKGRYSVEFLPRQASPPHPEQEAAPPVPRAGWLRALSARFAWILLIASIGGAAVFFVIRRQSPASSPAPPNEHFWGRVFNPARETYIVVADSGFGLLQDVTGQSLSLDQYLSGTAPEAFQKGPSAPDGELIRRLVGRQYTSVSDASIAFQLGQMCRAFSGRANIRSARSINIRDMKTHNIILLGSARSNPWVGLLREKMNFFLDYDGQPPCGVVRNSKPAAGESDAYRATARSGQPGDAYGLVAWIPNLDSTGSIVTLSGTNMEGTEAAAEVLLNAASFEKLRSRLGVPRTAPFPYFEAVIRAHSQAGAGSNAEIVTSRKAADR